MLPTIENIDDLRGILSAADLHIEASYGEGSEILYHVCRRSVGALPIHRVPEELVQEALKGGLLIESRDYCSCFNLVQPLHDESDLEQLCGLAQTILTSPGNQKTWAAELEARAHVLQAVGKQPVLADYLVSLAVVLQEEELPWQILWILEEELINLQTQLNVAIEESPQDLILQHQAMIDTVEKYLAKCRAIVITRDSDQVGMSVRQVNRLVGSESSAASSS